MKRFLTIAVLAACSKAPATAPVPAPPTVPETVGAPGSQDLAGLGNLVPILRDEAAHRPTVAVTPERLFDALAKVGLAVTERKQVLARSADAKFCALGKLASPTGLVGVIACEYASAADAIAARAKLDHSRIANVAREVRGATVVTVTNVATNADRERRVFDVLHTL